MEYKAKKLPFGETTDEGSWWAEVDGQKIGEKGRAFWQTKSEAITCAKKYIENLKNYIGTKH